MSLWLYRLSALVVGVVVGLALVEGGLRLWDAATQSGLAATEFEGSVVDFCPARHHCLLPNSRMRQSGYGFNYLWTNNALGMRDIDRPLEKPPGSFRILVLGDSITEGHGVRLEDMMTRRLEGMLNSPPRKKSVEVLNAAVFGYSPLLEYLYLRELIDPIEPDLVALGFFLENDTGDDYFYTERAHFSPDGTTASFSDQDFPWLLVQREANKSSEEPGEPPSQAGGPADRPSSRTLAHSWQAIKDTARSTYAGAVVKRWVDTLKYPRERRRILAFVQAHRGDIRVHSGLINYPVLTRSERLAYWDLSAKYLRQIAELCRSRGVPMVLFVIPPVQRLNGMTDFAEPYEVIDDIGKTLGVPVIQLLPDFLQHDAYALYFPLDHHWAPEGNRVAAEVLDRELRKLHLLPPEG